MWLMKLCLSLVAAGMIFLHGEALGVQIMLKVAYDPNLPPFQFEEEGRARGIHIDIIDKIAEENNFTIDYIPVSGLSNCLDAMEYDRADIVLGMKMGEAVNSHLYYTESISQSNVCMVVNKKNAVDVRNVLNFSNLSLALENNSIKYSYIQNIKKVGYVVLANQREVFDFLVGGRVDLSVGVKDSMLYQLKRAGLSDDYIIINDYMAPIEYTMGVKPGNVELREKLNESVQRLRVRGDYEKIYNKWIDHDDYQLRRFLQMLFYLLAAVLIVVSTVFFFNFRLNILLKRQVNEKTLELQRINHNLAHQVTVIRNMNELKNCIVENSPSGIVVFDTNYQITLFNHNAAKITGLSQQPIGQSILDINLFRNILQDKLSSIFTDGRKFINEEIRVERSQEGEIVYRYDIYQLFNADNDVRGVILTIEDVTNEMRVREDMYEKEKNKALNQIIAGIAHEVRNPLMSIKTFIQLIPAKMTNPGFTQQLLDVVPKEVDRVNGLIKNLIDYAKPGTINKNKINIGELLNSCIVLISPVLKSKKIDVFVDIEDNLTIYADRSQVKQVLMNIILNGYEAIQERRRLCGPYENKPSLRTRAWQTGTCVLVEIKDEGTGMTKEELKHALELFFTTKPNGTGIGLPLSRQYVEENGGSIMIESEKHQYTKITLKFRR